VPGATAHPEDDLAAVLDEAFGELGLRVLKLHCSVGAFAPDDPRLDPLWERVSEGGQPVVLHAGDAVNGATTAAEVAAVGRVAERWPEARIVVAHCGSPAVGTTLALLRRARSLYADLTPRVHDPIVVTRSEIAGLERRLLLGSDAPNVAIPIESSIARVRAIGLPPEHEAAILGANAERLLAGL
jgi:predicted TIM-barrel fold metal-dependent hydrolase